MLVRKIYILSLICITFLSFNCKKIYDPISLEGVILSGGVIDFRFSDFTFRIQENIQIPDLRELYIYGINDQDSIIIKIHSVNGLQSTKIFQVNQFRTIVIWGKFHSLPEYIGINSSWGTGTLTFTHIDTNFQISGEFSENAIVIGLDNSNPNDIITFPVKISGKFNAKKITN